MSNLDKYNATFAETLRLEAKDLPGLKYQDVQAWDSVGHMQLMTALEECFSLELEIDDIIAFSSYETGKEILAKYGIAFDAAA